VTTKHRFLILLVTIVSHLAVLPIAVFSQTPFYQGKTLKIVNNDPGGTAGMRVKAVVP
jgi:capsular polysaccharide biosynthesis protein